MFTMKSLSSLLLVTFGALLYGCSSTEKPPEPLESDISDPAFFHESLYKLTDIIVYDVFSPPVASRIYVYPCVAAYEVLAQKYPGQRSLSQQLNQLESLPPPADTANISLEVAAIYAFIQTGKSLIFSEERMEQYAQEYIAKLSQLGLSEKSLASSLAYGKKAADHILRWASKDNYKETRSAPGHTISNFEGKWQPTPPAYMEAIEPQWNQIRTMVLNNAEQFKPAAPPAYDMSPNSEFYADVIEVMEAVNKIKREERAIASFWDCNPYVINQSGHMMFASKKITPGGHWMGIASIASKKANHDMMQAIETATLTSVGLFDAFISCWDEKYRSNLIRPETVINMHLDQSWRPILQTPPFPEYSSGHSVISSTAAIILTDLLGDNFSYTDSVEVKYGLPARSYQSFLEASEEAAISRLYGGIHYMPAIKNGVLQGKQIGRFIASNITTIAQSR